MLNYKVAITGTTSGIGQATAKLFRGCTQINRDQFDLSKTEWLDQINLSDYDVLINNAGSDYNRANFIDHDFHAWNETMHVNLLTPMRLTQMFMQQNDTGVIVNVLSSLSPNSNSSIAYQTGKYAMEGFIDLLRARYKQYRFVNIKPGRVKTEMRRKAGDPTPYENDFITPEDVAKAIKYAIDNEFIQDLTIKHPLR